MEDLDQSARNAARASVELTQTEAAFQGLREAIIREWAACPPEQERKITKLHLAMQTLEGVRTALLNAVAAGEMANYRVSLAEAGLTRPS